MTTGQQQIFLGTLFDTAAENVKPILLPGYKDAADYFNRAPGAKEGLKIYKDVFADQLERSHLENNGILSDEKYHGPSGVYYPMRGVNDGQPTGLFARLRSPVQTTRNIHNFVQTGLSDRYDVTPQGFVDSFRGAISSNARNAGRRYFFMISNSDPVAPCPNVDLISPKNSSSVANRHRRPMRRLLRRCCRDVLRLQVFQFLNHPLIVGLGLFKHVSPDGLLGGRENRLQGNVVDCQYPTKPDQ